MKKHIISNADIAAAGGVAEESLDTYCRVGASIGVVLERFISKSVVAETKTGGTEGLETDSRTQPKLFEPNGTAGETLKGLITYSSVSAANVLLSKACCPTATFGPTSIP